MEVIWDTEKIYVDLPLASMTLGSLKSYLSSKTGVLPNQMKLYMNGGLMKDNLTPLSAYQNEMSQTSEESNPEESIENKSSFWSGILGGIKKNKKPLMKIRMIGSIETKGFVIDRSDLESHRFNNPSEPSNNHSSFSRSHSNSNQPSLTNETNSITEIRELTNQTVLNLRPKVEELEASVQADDQEPKTWDSNQLQSFSTVSEMLLQSLLKLDGFEIDVEWNEARAARKESVKLVQSLLDRLDQAKANQTQK
ncbi:uncharacterized protein MELLADRAFT_76892 [Melampsora larici-populina 98AG31]|uniref:BAG domain-containing protein n=1 Tax=Melampsora larici-populina (strain 98AG31 / pathotype 3-4-7) TaxID=747676 RepID=F4RA07_MELLP|nr:uncharacterized protein MELLADRAFT_76892 [Melampsora larici-populina 98AG31]EGG10652.1 hypothetical protein MELLADRAFT_76892 [Melampsora larici-populina 98AG31]